MHSNRPFSYSVKEPGSSVIFIHLHTRGSIDWRLSFYHYCVHSKILQNVAKYPSIEILFRIAKKVYAGPIQLGSRSGVAAAGVA